jgi:hypothetical protein
MQSEDRWFRDELRRHGTPGAGQRRGGRRSHNDRWQDAYGGPGRPPGRVDSRGRGPRGYAGGNPMLAETVASTR